MSWAADDDKDRAGTDDGVTRSVFLPLTMPARVGSTRAFAWGSGGYDSTAKGPVIDAGAEVTLWGPVALRGGAVYSNATTRMRPYVTARVQLLREEAHGVDGAFGASFKTEGFTEAEGEVEVFASLSRRVGSTLLVGNLFYGQDPEGNERDGEFRAAAFQHRGRFTLGLDSRLRRAIGKQNGKAATIEPLLDAAVAPVGMVAVGSFVIFTEVGPSALKMPNASTRFGVTAMGGLGSVF